MKVVFGESSYGGYKEISPMLRARSGSNWGGEAIVVEDAYCIGNGQANQTGLNKTVGALNCMDGQQNVMMKNPMKVANYTEGDKSAAIDASYYKGTGSRNGKEREFIVEPASAAGVRKYIVRRLTPLECCRLQGFPDYWCEGIKGSDSAQYKMWGNGMTLPVILYILQGIKEGAQ